MVGSLAASEKGIIAKLRSRFATYVGRGGAFYDATIVCAVASRVNFFLFVFFEHSPFFCYYFETCSDGDLGGPHGVESFRWPRTLVSRSIRTIRHGITAV